MSNIKSMLRALRHRNYRLFFFGQGISLVGTWMQQVGMGWLVYRLTRSAFLLGIVGFTSQIPAFILTPLAGVMVDRHNKHHILIVTQVLAMVQAFILGSLVITGNITIWQIITLSLFLGLVNGIDAPCRQAFIIEMVNRREDLGNAIALNSLIFNGARLVGPFMAGIIIALMGEGVCFILNGLSYIAVIMALFAMRIRYMKKAHPGKNVLEGLKEGVAYAFGFMPIRGILLLLGLFSLMGMSYAVLMPVFTIEILHGGADTLGFLMASFGLGALGGAVYLASRKTIIGFWNKIAFASGMFGMGLAAFSVSHSLPLSLVLMAFMGFNMMVYMASSNTVLQTIVDDDKRGRVMGLYIMAFMGMAPFGSLLIGLLASSIGAPATLLLGAISCLWGSLALYAKLPSIIHMMQPIYKRMGIIQESTPGIESVAELIVPPKD